jgi:hypothetical protein
MKTTKSFPVKDDLRRAFQITIGLPLVLAACVLSGCASWPTEGPSGTLTITGIPAEYEGKFIKSSLYLPLQIDKSKVISNATPKEVARSPAAAITNGEIRLPLYEKKAGYFASDTADVCLRIGDTAENFTSGNAGFDFIFAEARFENGVKELKWDGQVTPGFITITNIPADFVNGSATVSIGSPSTELKTSSLLGTTIVTGAEATCSITFGLTVGSDWQDTRTEKFFVKVDGKYLPFAQSGARDVIVNLAKPDDSGKYSYSFLQFKAASIQDGKITLDLSKGVKQ